MKKDLFTETKNLPSGVQKIITQMNANELDYIDLKYYQDRMIQHGYIFDFDLCAIPYNLQKIEINTIQDIIKTDIFNLL